jgi:hypothetical protein
MGNKFESQEIDLIIAQKQRLYPEIIDWEAFRTKFYALSPEQRVRLIRGATVISRKLSGRTEQSFLMELADVVAVKLSESPASDPLELMFRSIGWYQSRFLALQGRMPRDLKELARWWSTHSSAMQHFK